MQTGSFRITIPQPDATVRESNVPTTGAAGSLLVTPNQPHVEPPLQLKTLPIQPAPMPQAAPIETPKATPAQGSGDPPPTRDPEG